MSIGATILVYSFSVIEIGFILKRYFVYELMVMVVVVFWVTAAIFVRPEQLLVRRIWVAR